LFPLFVPFFSLFFWHWLAPLTCNNKEQQLKNNYHHCSVSSSSDIPFSVIIQRWDPSPSLSFHHCGVHYMSLVKTWTLGGQGKNKQGGW
jgi:hypothetical protein